MPSLPQRIVSLVPSTTESVFAFGAGDRLVGCTRYCTEPADQLVGVARVGGTKNPALEGILRLRPDLVLGNAEENRPEDLAWLGQRTRVVVQTPCTVLAAAADLRSLGELLGTVDEVQPFLVRIEAQLAAAAVANLRRAPLRTFYAVWRKPWMGVNRSTFVHDVLRVAGAVNVCADEDERYPEVLPEAVAARSVDVVLLPSEPWEFTAEQRDELLAEQRFGRARLALCDGRDFCWHGVRMADGLGRAVDLLARLRAGMA